MVLYLKHSEMEMNTSKPTLEALKQCQAIKSQKFIDASIVLCNWSYFTQPATSLKLEVMCVLTTSSVIREPDGVVISTLC